ncbi:MAG: CPBP family intramembrane metalloprotease [Verrucomicrobia bacterium]|nr:CPBP family intramembrane metalloprotease [Verrucomicrobiota bacterium]
MMEIKEESNRLSRKSQLIEVLVFLFLIVPSLVFSFYHGKEAVEGNFNILAIFTVFRDLGLLFLILFFLWRNGESLEMIGLHCKNFWKELGLGVLLFIPCFIGMGFLEKELQILGFSSPQIPLQDVFKIDNWINFIFGFILVVVVAFVEEIIFRGYLILRFRTLCRSAIAAVLLSSFIFSLGHGYEGNSGVITVGVTGLILGSIYVWRKSLVAPITIHFLIDLINVLLLSFYTAG